jgi:hypothetical protein
MQKRGRDLISSFGLPSSKHGDKQVDNETKKVRIRPTCSKVSGFDIAIRRNQDRELVVLFAEHTRTHRTHVMVLLSRR